MLKVLVSICSLAVGLAALAAGSPLRGGMAGMPESDPAIAKVREAYRSAVLAGDAAAVAAVFGEEGVEMPPASPPVRGRAAIERYYRELFASGVRFQSFVLAPSEERIVGDVAFVAGTSRQTVVPPGAPSGSDCPGKFLVVLKRDHGSWRVAYAIYNLDAPIGPPR
jgi:uncharacterized protein (TIGR02246 family)